MNTHEHTHTHCRLQTTSKEFCQRERCYASVGNRTVTSAVRFRLRWEDKEPSVVYYRYTRGVGYCGRIHCERERRSRDMWSGVSFHRRGC
eukprot:663718-Pyramimonas_sp.AAC.1